MTRFNATTAAGQPTGASIDANGDLSINSAAPTNLDAVETIGSLKALTGMGDGTKRLVMGYYAAGDGGGGTFRFNASSSATDNGGTIIAPTTGTGRWERMITEPHVVYAEWFGTKGDLTFDDTSAIQAAVDYGITNDTGMTVKLSRLQYRIQAAINIPIGYHWSIKGAGNALGKPRITQYTNNTPHFKLAHNNHSFSIENLGLWWNTQQTTSNTSSYGVMFTTISSAETQYFGRLRDLDIRYGYRGIGIYNASGTNPVAVWKTTIEDTNIKDCAGSAISLVSPVAVGMPSNSLINVGIYQSGSPTSEYQIQLSAQTGFSSYNLDIEGATGAMMYIDSSTAVFHNMHIENVALPAGSGSVNLMYFSGSDVTLNGIDCAGTTANTAYTKLIKTDGSTVNLQGWRGGFNTTSGPVMLLSGVARQVRCLTLPNFTGTATTLVRLDYEGLNFLAQLEVAYPGDRAITADNGNVDVTLTYDASEMQLFNSVISAARTVNLPTHVANTGSLLFKRFRIIRTASATGAFNIDIKHSGTTLKSLAAPTPGTWAELVNNGSGWFVVASGSL